MSSAVLNLLIENFNHLDLADKEYVLEIIKKQLIEAKREAIAKNVREAYLNLKKGLVKKGTVKELYKDLEGD